MDKQLEENKAADMEDIMEDIMEDVMEDKLKDILFNIGVSLGLNCKISNLSDNLTIIHKSGCINGINILESEIKGELEKQKNSLLNISVTAIELNNHIRRLEKEKESLVVRIAELETGDK